MANVVAIKIRPRKDRTPSGANLAHNSGMTKASYWLGDGSDITQSHKYDSSTELNDDYNSWVYEANNRYEKNPNTKTKLRSQAVRIEEGMIIIGTDVQASKENIINITHDFIKEFEKHNNTKVRHWAYHDHEGHQDNDKIQINRHIHFLFDNVSNDGVIIRSKWKKDYLSELQDIAYKVSLKYTQVERARNTVGKGIRGKHHREFRKEQELKEITMKNELATQIDLKVEVAKLRAELQANGATRADYAKLEATVKELKELIKAKDLTIDELNKALQDTKSIQDKLDHTKEALKASTLANETLAVKNEKQSKSMDNINKIYHDGCKELGIEQKLTFKGFFAWVKEKFTEFKEEISRLRQEIQMLKAENNKLKSEALKSINSSELNIDNLHDTDAASSKPLSKFNKKSTESESQKENLKRTDDAQILDENTETDGVVRNNNKKKKKN